MKGHLTIKGDLQHDGDGVVRIHFAAGNENFSGTTAAWAADTQVAELVSLLAGFPLKTPSEVTYTFGSPKSGQCSLRFVTIDNVVEQAHGVRSTHDGEAPLFAPHAGRWA